MLVQITEMRHALERLMLAEETGATEHNKCVSLYADLLKIEMDTPRDKWPQTFVTIADAANVATLASESEAVISTAPFAHNARFHEVD